LLGPLGTSIYNKLACRRPFPGGSSQPLREPSQKETPLFRNNAIEKYLHSAIQYRSVNEISPSPRPCRHRQCHRHFGICEAATLIVSGHFSKWNIPYVFSSGVNSIWRFLKRKVPTVPGAFLMWK